MSEYRRNQGITRIIKAAGYSTQGLRQCYKYESAFRQEVWASFIIVPLGLWLGETGTEKALLVSSWMLVLIVELLNSAVEAAIDRFGPERHQLSGRAKDIASAAVFVAISLAVLVWLLVLLWS